MIESTESCGKDWFVCSSAWTPTSCLFWPRYCGVNDVVDKRRKLSMAFQARQGCCCKVAISTTAQAYAACRSVRHSRSHATPHFNARHFVSSPSACLHLLALPDMPLDFCFTSYARHNWIWQILLGIICIHIFVPSIIRVFVYRYKYRCVCALSCIINHGNLISAIISGV